MDKYYGFLLILPLALLVIYKIFTSGFTCPEEVVASDGGRAWQLCGWGYNTETAYKMMDKKCPDGYKILDGGLGLHDSPPVFRCR